MKVSIQKFLWIAVFSLLFMIALPAAVQAQGRGRGRGPDMSKKCGKFVNCHDARDGRVDGRGPRRDAFRRGVFVGRNHNHRRFRNVDDGRFARARRIHRVREFRGEGHSGRHTSWTRVARQRR